MKMLFAVLILVLCPWSQAECSKVLVQMDLSLYSQEAAASFAEQAPEISLSSAEINYYGYSELQHLKLKDPACLAKAIKGFDSAQSLVLYVETFVRGEVCGEGQFTRDGDLLMVRLEVGDKGTPVVDRLHNWLGGHSLYFRSDSTLDKTEEVVYCEFQ